MPEEFVTYLLESQPQKVHNPKPPGIHDPNDRHITPAPPGHRPPPDLLAEFKRGVIWDPTIFEMIKDIKQCDYWKRTFVVTAEAQGVNKVIDSKYIPPPSGDALFCEQKKYM